MDPSLRSNPPLENEGSPLLLMLVGLSPKFVCFGIVFLNVKTMYPKYASKLDTIAGGLGCVLGAIQGHFHLHINRLKNKDTPAILKLVATIQL